MRTILAAMALTAVSLTGCTPATTPEVEIGEAVTVEAETGLISAIAQDAGSPVETLR